MDVVKTLRPGQPGTKRLKERYGDRLIAVRYRLDRLTGTHYTTVELVVEQKYVLHRSNDLPSSPATPPASPSPAAKTALRILRHEHELQRQVRQAGGQWDPRNQVWLIEAEAVERLGLQERIIRGEDY